MKSNDEIINIEYQYDRIRYYKDEYQEFYKIMEETIEITKDNDTNMKIAYSSKYMLEEIRSLKCDNIEIKLNSEIKPIIIKNTEDDNLIQLVLPIKTF